jgi:predicted amidohydrolase
LATGKKNENRIAIFDHGEYVESYSKIHLFGFDDGEKTRFQAGNELSLINRYGVDLGFAICYDLRFPELFRKYRSLGTSVFIIPASWPEPRVEHWTTLLKARAIENQAFVIGCNAVGIQGDVTLGGRSMIISPLGKVYGEASPNNEELLIVTLDFSETEDTRIRFPVNEDIFQNYEKIIFTRS